MKGFGDYHPSFDGLQMNVTTGFSMSTDCMTLSDFSGMPIGDGLLTPLFGEETRDPFAIRGWRCVYCGAFYPGDVPPSTCFDFELNASRCGGRDFVRDTL